MSDFDSFQIHTLQPSGTTSSGPFHQNTYHQKAFENFAPMVANSRHLLALVAVWELYECVTQ
jgi:hypothetical protein